jgi:phage anti-repressor protein
MVEKFQGLEELLLSEFSEDDQQLFINNFKQYLEYNADKDFVIDLDNVYKWMGFTQKGNAKRLLEKKLDKDIHYTISGITSTENMSGGYNREIILMTPNGFKDLCMLSNTEKAKCIRKYYIKMEYILFKAMELSLQNTNNENSEFKKKILYLEDKIKKSNPRTKIIYPAGESVYIYKIHCTPDLYKIGRSDNMNKREPSYYCHSTCGSIIYTISCKNSKALELALHTRFSDYRYNNRHDWFIIKFEELRESVDKMQLLMDTTPGQFTINLDAPVYNSIVEDSQSKPDFDRFITECFDIDKEGKSTWVDIISRLRLWTRNNTDYKDELVKYFMDKGYIHTFIYDDENKCRHNGYRGLKIKPLPGIFVTESSSIEEKFLYECCETSITGRISTKQLRNKYFEWRKNKDPSFPARNIADMIDIKKVCNRLFMAANVHDGQRIREGYYGCCLKECKNVGKKHRTNGKKINQLDPKTGEIITTYGSMQHAASELGISISTISRYLAEGKQYKEFLFRLAEN